MPPKPASSDWLAAVYAAKLAFNRDRARLYLLMAQYHVWQKDIAKNEADGPPATIAPDDPDLDPAEYRRRFQRLCNDFAYHPPQPCPALPPPPTKSIPDCLEGPIASNWADTLNTCNKNFSALSAECNTHDFTRADFAERDRLDAEILLLKQWRVPSKVPEAQAPVIAPTNINVIAPTFSNAPDYGLDHVRPPVLSSSAAKRGRQAATFVAQPSRAAYTPAPPVTVQQPRVIGA